MSRNQREYYDDYERQNYYPSERYSGRYESRRPETYYSEDSRYYDDGRRETYYTEYGNSEYDYGTESRYQNYSDSEEYSQPPPPVGQEPYMYPPSLEGRYNRSYQRPTVPNSLREFNYDRNPQEAVGPLDNYPSLTSVPPENQEIYKDVDTTKTKRKCQSRRCIFGCLFSTSLILVASAIALFFLFPRVPTFSVISLQPDGVIPAASQNGEGQIRVGIPGQGVLNSAGQVIRQQTQNKVVLEMSTVMKMELRSDNFIRNTIQKLQIEVFFTPPPAVSAQPVKLNTTNLANVQLVPKKTTSLTFPITLVFAASSLADPALRNILTTCGILAQTNSPSQAKSSILTRVSATTNIRPLSNVGIAPTSNMDGVNVVCPGGDLSGLRTAVTAAAQVGLNVANAVSSAQTSNNIRKIQSTSKSPVSAA